MASYDKLLRSASGQTYPRRRGAGGKLHPLLREEMVQSGRALFYDPAILTADPKQDDWSIRILAYLDSRWGPNWVSKKLAETGGRMTERLVIILDRAGIKYEKQPQAQGRPWLRRTFQGAMQKLHEWQPKPLIGGYQCIGLPCIQDPRMMHTPPSETRRLSRQGDPIPRAGQIGIAAHTTSTFGTHVATRMAYSGTTPSTCH